MDEIPFIRHFVSICKEPINQFNTNLINNENHRHITYQGWNIIVRLPNTTYEPSNACQAQAYQHRYNQYSKGRNLDFLRVLKVNLCQPHAQDKLPKVLQEKAVPNSFII